jgi:hypothetical protein
MKKISVCLIFIFFATFALAAADESEVILQAQTDAKEDGENYCAFGVGLGACFLSFCMSPLAGIVLTGAAYHGREAEVPAIRITAIQDKYDDADSIALYESQYKTTLTVIKRRKDGGAALAGTAVIIAVYLGAFIYLASGWEM